TGNRGSRDPAGRSPGAMPGRPADRRATRCADAAQFRGLPPGATNMHVSASPARRAVARPALAVLVIALLSLAACGSQGKSGSGALGSQSGAPSVSPTAGGTVTPTNTPTTSVTTTATSTASSANGGPTIVDFSIKQQPACPVVGTSDAPFHQDGVD